jgi:hypothetical protein
VRKGRDSTDLVGQEGLIGWLRSYADDLGDADLVDSLIDHLEEVGVQPPTDDIAIVLIGWG